MSFPFARELAFSASNARGLPTSPSSSPTCSPRPWSGPCCPSCPCRDLAMERPLPMAPPLSLLPPPGDRATPPVEGRTSVMVSAPGSGPLPLLISELSETSGSKATSMLSGETSRDCQWGGVERSNPPPSSQHRRSASLLARFKSARAILPRCSSSSRVNA